MENDQDLMILLADFSEGYPNIDKSLQDWGIGAVVFLDKNRIDEVFIASEATEYLNNLHKIIHDYLEGKISSEAI